MAGRADTPWDLCLTADISAPLSADQTAGMVIESVRGGVGAIRVRDGRASDAVFAERALRIRGAVSRAISEPGPYTPFHVPVFVHDRFRVALRHSFHLHLDEAEIDYPEARRRMPGELMIGVSVDDPDDVRELVTECRQLGVRGPDVIWIGPVWSTGERRRQTPPLGPEAVDAVARAAAAAGVTSFAQGGITFDNVDKLGGTAVDGVCVSTTLMTDHDPFTSARTLLTRFRPAEVRHT
ncbi:thiamine phosphate synthase [Corynebacterium meridianum]|uniref:thiamine phosphate synthase n=1 Tax=Corynebacterium meridianum TaxID=2765363 RepID=UPI003AB97C5D